jgi:DNA repair protein RecO (recombination protein O)
MKYKKLTGIVLKKQNYKEADQILTIWTREAGKVRVLAKSIRLPKSKLAYAVGDLSLAAIDIAGRHSLPVLIGAKPISQFSNLRQDLQKTIIGLYAAELMLKMTADEHPNQKAFELLSDFLHDLEKLDYSVKYHPLLECFSLSLLESLGFKMPQNLDREQIIKMDLNQIEEIHRKINKFIEYILERHMKAESLFASIN